MKYQLVVSQMQTMEANYKLMNIQKLQLESQLKALNDAAEKKDVKKVKKVTEETR
jgi:hypothetical protein